MQLQEAKLRLLELGQRKSAPLGLMSSPMLRAGAFLIAGAMLGRRIGARGKEGGVSSIAAMLGRAGLASAPLLVEQFVRGVFRRAASRDMDSHVTERRAKSNGAEG